MKKRKSVTRLTENDTRKASKYVLTHQGVDSDGDLTTKYVKVRCNYYTNWILFGNIAYYTVTFGAGNIEDWLNKKALCLLDLVNLDVFNLDLFCCVSG